MTYFRIPGLLKTKNKEGLGTRYCDIRGQGLELGYLGLGVGLGVGQGVGLELRVTGIL